MFGQVRRRRVRAKYREAPTTRGWQKAAPRTRKEREALVGVEPGVAMTRRKELWHDINSIFDMAANLAASETHLPGVPVERGWRLSGTIIGPRGNEIEYQFSCRKPQSPGEFGPGTCSVIEIERSGPGAAKLRKRTTVGNLYGLATQLARDVSRAWGVEPSPTRGFEGVRRRRRRRR